MKIRPHFAAGRILDLYFSEHHNFAEFFMGRVTNLRFPLTFPVFLCLASGLFSGAGCNNTCGSFTFNGTSSTGNVTVASPPPTCKLNGTTGIVSFAVGAKSEAKPAMGSTRAHITHLFVTLAGVDMHPSALAEDAAPGWEPIAAQLQQHPIQVDLLADAQESNSFAPFPDAILPAGLYGQMRLRLAIPPASGQLLEPNHCGDKTLHCAVTSDGRVLPLRFLESATNIRIHPDNTDGQRLYVPPDGSTALRIELDADRSFLLPLGDSFLVAPVFRLNIQRPDGTHEF